MPLKILIVDESENLKVMRSLTNVLGHYVQTFYDAGKAGEWVQTHRIDVALVGMRQGLELSRQSEAQRLIVKPQSWCLMLPTILTRHERPSAMASTLCLPKPFPRPRFVGC
jgi:hypothetical protein